MNVIELLKRDHKEAMTMMDQLQTADKGSQRSTMDMFTKLKEALTLHSRTEEQVLYTTLQSYDETRDMITESYQEHKEVDELLAEMTGMDPSNDAFMDKLSELRDSVMHHVEEEETEMFPKAEQVLGQNRLQELGQQFQEMKKGISATATTKQMK